ncbi:MAG TPA: phenylalanine--tRNA ligase beta subunit-related protein [Acidimicrobiia bacterium]
MMGGFGYHADIIERFPGVRGSVIHATALVNGTSSPELRSAYEAEQNKVVGQIGDTPLSAIPSLEAWRRTFSSFGVKPTQYRNAAEALLRRLTKHGDVPSINSLVDMANMVSIRYRLPVAVCDQRAVTGVTTVRFATGNERFTDIGSGETTTPEPGEVVFVDDELLASARRWCWRQGAESAAGPQTEEAIFTIEAQHKEGERDVSRATNDLLEHLSVYQPQAQVTHGLLSLDSPWFQFGSD